MKKMLLPAALLACLASALCSAQSLVPNCRNTGGQYIPCVPVVMVDKTGTIIDASNPLPVSGGGGGSGSGTAPADPTTGTTQQAQLTQEQLTAARLGDASTPAAGTINARLNSLLIALGTPLQAGGTIASIANPVAVTGAFYQQTQPISAASLPLPSGAATAAGVAAVVTALGSPYQAGGALPLPSGAATASGVSAVVTALGSPYQAGGALPLPSGASTLAAQNTGNGSLATIATNTTGIATAAKQDTSNGYLATLAGNAGQAAAPYTWSASGTIAALNGNLDIVAPGAGSVVLDVSTSNFAGTLTAYGCADAACTVLGPRLMFKSGVGSIGTNAIVLTGGTVAREYRLVAGGNRVRIVATAYTSGTVSLIGFAQPSNNIVFVNGPVHTAEEEAVRASRAFSASTGVVAVSNGNYLNTVLCNPAGSGVNMMITQKRYALNLANGATPGEYQSFANPTTVPTTNGTIANRWVGSSVTSAATFKYQMSGTNLSGGVQTAGGILPTGGLVDVIDVASVLTPGNCTGISIGGAGGGLAAAARGSAAFVWYEESIN